MLTINNFPTGTNLVTRTGVAASNSPVTNGTTGLPVLSLPAGAITSGKNVTVLNGLLSLGAANAVAAGGIVNIGDQGSWMTDPAGGATNGVYPTSGTFNILPGGVVYDRKAFGGLAAGATFNWSAGSKIVIYSETGGNVDTTANGLAAANGLVDWNILWNNGIAFTGGTNGGLILGDGRRITMSSSTGPATINAGSGIKVANATSNALITAPVGMTLNIADNINMNHPSVAGFSTLQIGDTGTYFNTTGDSTTLAQVAQTGTVNLATTLTSTVTAPTINVVAGTANFGIATIAAPISNFTTGSPTIGTVNYSTGTASTWNLDGTATRLITTQVNVLGATTLTVNKVNNSSPFNFVGNTPTGGINLSSGANLSINLAGSAVVRANVSLGGNATLTNISGTSNVAIGNLNSGSNTLTLGSGFYSLTGGVNGTAGVTALVAPINSTLYVDPANTAFGAISSGLASTAGNITVNNLMEVKTGTNNIINGTITTPVTSVANQLAASYYRPAAVGAANFDTNNGDPYITSSSLSGNFLYTAGTTSGVLTGALSYTSQALKTASGIVAGDDQELGARSGKAKSPSAALGPIPSPSVWSASASAAMTAPPSTSTPIATASSRPPKKSCADLDGHAYATAVGAVDFTTLGAGTYNMAIGYYNGQVPAKAPALTLSSSPAAPSQPPLPSPAKTSSIPPHRPRPASSPPRVRSSPSIAVPASPPRASRSIP